LSARITCSSHSYLNERKSQKCGQEKAGTSSDPLIFIILLPLRSSHNSRFVIILGLSFGVQALGL